MNIALNFKDIQSIDHNIKFLDTKRNNIMDGEFTKILYSDKCVTLNGVYIICPLHLYPQNASSGGGGSASNSIVASRQRSINNANLYPYKNIITFQPNHPINTQIIHQFAQFEKQLIALYKKYTFSKKIPVYSLHNQLSSGNTKYYREIQINTIANPSTTNVWHIIKISGIWETSQNIGITYKFLEMYDFSPRNL